MALSLREFNPFLIPESMIMNRLRCYVVLLSLLIAPPLLHSAETATVDEIFTRIDNHRFHPLNDDGSFTNDRQLGKRGVADLDDEDWKIRLLSIRDLVLTLPDHAQQVRRGLEHSNLHVRQITAAAVGIGRDKESVAPLTALLKSDPSPLVRSQAAMSLGQLEATEAASLLNESFESDSSRDVRHQCELALDQIAKRAGASEDQLEAFRSLDATQFELAKVGEPAPDFTLKDTTGKTWTLGDRRGKWVVLVWIFADWCPVCHSEFNDLLEMRSQFEDANAVVATIECHDRYRCRLMVGQETDARYWFSKNSFQQRYQEGIWWPHLSDLAGQVGATYGADPMAFAVHAEYVNRPSTIIIDPTGVVSLAYVGTYWGDRPTMHQTLEMIRHEEFNFEHPNRRKTASASFSPAP